jgi:hypothetical protein
VGRAYGMEGPFDDKTISIDTPFLYITSSKVVSAHGGPTQNNDHDPSCRVFPSGEFSIVKLALS